MPTRLIEPIGRWRRGTYTDEGRVASDEAKVIARRTGSEVLPTKEQEAADRKAREEARERAEQKKRNNRRAR